VAINIIYPQKKLKRGLNIVLSVDIKNDTLEGKAGVR